MNEKAFIVQIARNYQDFKGGYKEGITIGISLEGEATKEVIKDFLYLSFVKELWKQHIPFAGKTTEHKRTKRRMFRLAYDDLCNSVNEGYYRVKEIEFIPKQD